MSDKARISASVQGALTPLAGNDVESCLLNSQISAWASPRSPRGTAAPAAQTAGLPNFGHKSPAHRSAHTHSKEGQEGEENEDFSLEQNTGIQVGTRGLVPAGLLATIHLLLGPFQTSFPSLGPKGTQEHTLGCLQKEACV